MKFGAPSMPLQSRTLEENKTKTTAQIKNSETTQSSWIWCLNQLIWCNRDADDLCLSGGRFVSSGSRIMKRACFQCEFLAPAHLKLCPCVAATANLCRELSMTHISHSKTGPLNRLHPLAPHSASIRNTVSLHGTCSSLGRPAPFRLNTGTWDTDVAKQEHAHQRKGTSRWRLRVKQMICNRGEIWDSIKRCNSLMNQCPSEQSPASVTPPHPDFKTYHPFIFSIIVQMNESGVVGSRWQLQVSQFWGCSRVSAFMCADESALRCWCAAKVRVWAITSL